MFRGAEILGLWGSGFRPSRDESTLLVRWECRASSRVRRQWSFAGVESQTTVSQPVMSRVSREGGSSTPRTHRSTPVLREYPIHGVCRLHALFTPWLRDNTTPLQKHCVGSTLHHRAPRSSGGETVVVVKTTEGVRPTETRSGSTPPASASKPHAHRSRCNREREAAWGLLGCPSPRTTRHPAHIGVPGLAQTA